MEMKSIGILMCVLSIGGCNPDKKDAELRGDFSHDLTAMLTNHAQAQKSLDETLRALQAMFPESMVESEIEQQSVRETEWEGVWAYAVQFNRRLTPYGAGASPTATLYLDKSENLLFYEYLSWPQPYFKELSRNESEKIAKERGTYIFDPSNAVELANRVAHAKRRTKTIHEVVARIKKESKNAKSVPHSVDLSVMPGMKATALVVDMSDESYPKSAAEVYELVLFYRGEAYIGCWMLPGKASD